MRLLISGYYGAGNLGDEALLGGLLTALADTGVRVTVASLDPAATRASHGVASVHRLHGLPVALLSHDAVVSGGGGLLQDTTSGRSLAYYLAVVTAARRLGRRVAVFGQSLGPLSQAGERRVRRALRGVPLGLRDAPSLALAARLGLAAHGVADASLLLPRWPAADLDPGGPLALVPRAGHPTVTDLLAEVGRRRTVVGERLRVVLAHPDHDRHEGRRLVAMLGEAEMVAPRDVSELRRALATARAVVSGRLHGLILGAAAGVPVAGIAYDPKVAGFADELAAPVVAVPATGDAAGLATASAMLNAFADRPTLDPAALAALEERARDGVRWLLDDALHVASSARS